MRRHSVLVTAMWAACNALFGCGGAHSGQNPQEPIGVGATAAGAGITAAAAGVIWAAGGGCRLQGCPYGTYCDPKNGFCQVRKCSEGCLDGTVCNEGLDRCQAPPPPHVPTDRLPQDDKIAYPPTMH